MPGQPQTWYLSSLQILCGLWPHSLWRIFFLKVRCETGRTQLCFRSQMEIVEHAKQSKKYFDLCTEQAFSRSYQIERTIFCVKSMPSLSPGLLVQTNFSWKHEWCPNGGLEKCEMTSLLSSGTDVRPLTPRQDCSAATEFHDDPDGKANPAVLMPSFFSSVTAAMTLLKRGRLPPLWNQLHWNSTEWH